MNQFTTQSLTLHVVVAKHEVESCVSQQLLRRDAGWMYVGLRKRVEDAVDRAVRTQESVSKETHVLLSVTFTFLGIAHFATLSTSAETQHQPMLHKVAYRGPYDWGVWHFLGDLPLKLANDRGDVLIDSEWQEFV